MQERFYSLWSKIEEDTYSLRIHFFYPKEFLWKDDIIWQEDLSYATERINEAALITPENKRIWIDPKVEILPFTENIRQG